MCKQKTWTAKAAELKSDWFVVDATDQVLGRLASGVAKVLRGKHKPTYTPHLNSGDHVVVINASKIKVSGTKLGSKEYTRYSGYPGGLRRRTLAKAGDGFLRCICSRTCSNRVGVTSTGWASSIVHSQRSLCSTLNSCMSGTHHSPSKGITA